MQNWSIAQKQRLVELNADKSITEREFESLKERDAAFKQLERDLVKENKEKLKNLMEREHIPLTLRVERELEKWLTEKEDYTLSAETN